MLWPNYGWLPNHITKIAWRSMQKKLFNFFILLKVLILGLMQSKLNDKSAEPEKPKESPQDMKRRISSHIRKFNQNETEDNIIYIYQLLAPDYVIPKTDHTDKDCPKLLDSEFPPDIQEIILYCRIQCGYEPKIIECPSLDPIPTWWLAIKL